MDHGVRIVISIVSYDVWFYISHILLHNYRFYKYHKEHHSKPNPIWIDTYKGHMLESIVQGVGLFLPCLIWQYALPDILIPLLFVNIRGMMRHDDRFSWLIGNHHLLHHRYPTYNFGEFWLDKIGGTKYPNMSAYRYGLLYT